jgi:glycosidase
LDSSTLHIRIQTALEDVVSVELVAGDPFEWKDKAWVKTTQSLRKSGSDGLHDFWETRYSPPHKRTKYYFIVRGTRPADVFIYGERGILPASEVAQDFHRNAFVFPYINEIDLYRAPSWVHGVVWYQIFPERFRNGNPALNPAGVLAWHQGPVTNREFYGGDLKGITQKLDHLAELGVGGVYLTPVFTSPSVHKYDTTDYLSIDPAFGSVEDLKTLVAEAHRRGIRILLDAVFNHSGTKFFAWQDVMEHGRTSAHADWFHVVDWDQLDRFRADPTLPGGPHGYETFSFARGMPKLNTANPAVRDYLIEVALHWIRVAGIDGWRLDVSNEIDQEFWRAFRKAVKAEAPEAYIVGEIWHDSQRWLRGDQYDAVMNYRYGNAVSDFVLGVNRMVGAADFVRTVDGIDAGYTLPVLRAAFNVLDSHDTDRFITRCGGDKDRARLGWLLLFILRGAPCVYYGSEVGMEGGHDPDNRRCMVWDEESQDRCQFEFLKTLVALRTRETDLLTYGEREWQVDPTVPDLMGLKVSHRGRTLEAWVNRSPAAWAWPSTSGRVVLESAGPWAHRVVLAES